MSRCIHRVSEYKTRYAFVNKSMKTHYAGDLPQIEAKLIFGEIIVYNIQNFGQLADFCRKLDVFPLSYQRGQRVVFNAQCSVRRIQIG